MVALPRDRRSLADARAARASAEIGRAFASSRAEELAELERSIRPRQHTSLIGAWLGSWLRAQARPLASPMPTVVPGEIGVTWIGHGTLRLAWPQLTVLTDPMLAGRMGMGRRRVAAPFAPAELDDVDVILVSGAEPDHLHWKTLSRLSRRATVVVPPGCGRFVSPLGFARLIELAPWSSLPMHGAEITALPAKHRGPIDTRSVAYLIRGQGPSVLVAGLGGYGPHWAEIGHRFRPDLAFLPIGGYGARGLARDNLSPAAALYAFEDVGARLLIPIRHGTFLRGYERVEEPARIIAALARRRGLDAHLALLAPGASETFSLGG